MADSIVIDLRSIESLRALSPGDNDEFLREITGIFLEDTPMRLKELDESLGSGELEKFIRAAHSIKGSSSNLGAFSLRSAAEKLENLSRETGLVGVEALVRDVKDEYARAAKALNDIIRVPPPN